MVLLPGDPLAARVRALLTPAGFTCIDAPSAESTVVIADTRAPNAPATLRDLQVPRAHLFLGLCDVEGLSLASLDDVLAVEALERELVPRVERLCERALVHREALRRQRDQKVLVELTAQYALATNIDELLHDVTRRLAKEMSIDRAAIVVVDKEKGVGTIVAASDDAALKDLRIDLARYPEIREVVRTNKPVIVEEAPSHPLLEDVKESVAARGIRNIAAMPLSVGDAVQGVLLLRRFAEPGAFVPREIDFLATVANATAVAFRNVRALESMRGQREKEKTARIAAEERATELKRYAAYFEHLSDGVAILDERGCVVSLNPAGLRLLELTPEASTGRHFNALTNPLDDTVLNELVLSVSRGEVRADVDVSVRTLAGRRLTLSLSGAPLDRADNAGVAVLTMRDVTVQRAVALELEQTKDFLERLIDSSVDAIIAADMKGTLMIFNKAAESICGYSAQEAVGQMHVRSIYADPETPRDIMRKLRSGEFGGKGRLTSSRVEILNKSGERIPVNMTAAIVLDGDTETATVGIFTDLRDRIRLERKLSDAETRLMESEKNALVVALAGTAAHELNQPLTSVMGYAELLKRKMKEGDPSYRSVDIIHREAERMAEIVRRIGKITRYETMAYVGDTEILDLNKSAGTDE